MVVVLLGKLGTRVGMCVMSGYILRGAKGCWALHCSAGPAGCFYKGGTQATHIQGFTGPRSISA